MFIWYNLSMLNREITLQPDAIEKYICVPISKAKQHQMTKDVSEMFISFTMMDKSSIDIDNNMDRDMVNDKGGKFWVYVALKKRVEACLTAKFNVKVLVFLMFLYESIGTCILMAYYMQYRATKRKLSEISIREMAEMFPNGFPSREDLHKIWDDSKIVDGGNLIDFGTAGSSIISA